MDFFSVFPRKIPLSLFSLKGLFFFLLIKKNIYFFFFCLKQSNINFWVSGLLKKKKIKQCKHLLRMKRFQLILFEVTGFLQVSWEMSCAYPGCWGCRKTPDFSPKGDDVRPQLCLLWFCFCSGTCAAVAWRKVGCRGPAQAPVTADDHAGPGSQQLAASQHEKFKLLAAWLAASNTAWAAYSSGSWPYGEIKNTNITLPWVPAEGPSFRQSFSISSYPYWQQHQGSHLCWGQWKSISGPRAAPCWGLTLGWEEWPLRHRRCLGSKGSRTAALLPFWTSTSPFAT